MHLRPARTDEVEQLTALAHAAKRHWGYPESWIATWRDDLTVRPAYLEANIVWVAEAGGTLQGFFALSPLEAPDVFEFDHFWVSPEAMGQGIGRILFRQAVALLQQQGVSELHILSDPQAVGFYERMGAHTFDEHVYELDGHPRRLPWLRYRVGS